MSRRGVQNILARMVSDAGTFYLRRQFSSESGLHRVTAWGSWMVGWILGTGMLRNDGRLGLVGIAGFGFELETVISYITRE